jgi:hypothetical protein
LTIVLAALWGCTGSDSPNLSVEETSTSSAAPGGTSRTTTADSGHRPSFQANIPGAVAVNIAVNGVDPPVVAWTSPGIVNVAELDLDRGALGPTTDVSGEFEPFAHPIERPAIAVRSSGIVDIAFTSLVGAGGSVFWTSWDRHVASPPLPISGDPRVETVLVHATHSAHDGLVLSWLEDSTLSVAVPDGDGTPIEMEMVDDLTCDCCNPVPVVSGDSGDEIVVAYRDLERSGHATYRDVVIARSEDGGATFEMVPVADDHWDLNACPFSGPAVVSSVAGIVVAWMDARQSVHPDQSSSTIWVDRSIDGGRTFGVDIAVSYDGINRWPVLALDGSGSLHLVWEKQGLEGGILYSHSVDGGDSFSPPLVLVANHEGSGRASSPSVAVEGTSLIVSWTAGGDGHIAVWELDNLR